VQILFFILLNFYDEREWRYVIPNDKYWLNEMPINFIPKEEFYEDGKFLDDHYKQKNSELQSRKLEFTNDDIKYLIVSRGDYIQRLAKYIKSECEYTKREQDLLISKIIPLRQIKEDF